MKIAYLRFDLVRDGQFVMHMGYLEIGGGQIVLTFPPVFGTVHGIVAAILAAAAIAPRCRRPWAFDARG